jgi:hypothetical protein
MTSFRDEMEKIAGLPASALPGRVGKAFQKPGARFVQALKEGWHGTPEQIAAGNGNTWFGQGTKITPEMGRLGRAWERFSSLGGLTKALPVGAKSMTALSTAVMARDALKAQDASGQNRSRTERLTGLAGNTVGGLVGGALASKALPGSALAAPIVGSIAGGMLGEKLTTLPWANKHQAPPMYQQVQQQFPVPPEYWPQYGQQVPQQPMPAPGAVR